MQGRIIVVTGAAGALGAVLAARLASAGAKVVGIDIAPAKEGSDLDAFFTANLGNPDEVAATAKLIGDHFGHVDGLVNVAGGFAWETVEAGSIETWDRLYDINVRSVVLVSKALLPLLRLKGGAVVNIGASAAVRADAGMGAYAASKSAVARLTESLANELKDQHVRVNAVLPSIIDTPANRRDMPDSDHDRWVQPAALADVILFLLSDYARAVTGASLPVTGRV